MKRIFNAHKNAIPIGTDINDTDENKNNSITTLHGFKSIIKRLATECKRDPLDRQCKKFPRLRIMTSGDSNVP
jgi:hypothetical protein